MQDGTQTFSSTAWLRCRTTLSSVSGLEPLLSNASEVLREKELQLVAGLPPRWAESDEPLLCTASPVHAEKTAPRARFNPGPPLAVFAVPWKRMLFSWANCLPAGRAAIISHDVLSKASMLCESLKPSTSGGGGRSTSEKGLSSSSYSGRLARGSHRPSHVVVAEACKFLR